MSLSGDGDDNDQSRTIGVPIGVVLGVFIIIAVVVIVVLLYRKRCAEFNC